MEFKDINVGDVFVGLYGQRLVYLCIYKSIIIDGNGISCMVYLLNLEYHEIPVARDVRELKDFEKIGHEDLGEVEAIFKNIAKKYIE